jgi:cellulose synthase/poly-beta-1,6-N-acetylglucosamine synthase-like glycosyltransferase
VADRDWLKNGVSKMTDGVGIVQGKTLPNPGQKQSTLQQTVKIQSEDGYYQTCNIFYRKECLDSTGGFSHAFCGLNFFGKPRWGGEDTDLAWTVKKQGWRSVFSDDTVVYHHIFPVTSLKMFLRSMHLSIIFTLAKIIKKHPEMRNTKLYRKVFKSQQRALFYILILSIVSGMLFHWTFFLFGFPYVIKILKISFHKRPISSYHRGFALFGLITLIELIESMLSMCASFINRTVVL